MIMTTKASQAGASCFIVPGRILRGSRSEMLAELEEAFRALMALRLVILAEETGAQSSPPENRYPTHGSVRR
jgi:hypothetical protein